MNIIVKDQDHELHFTISKEETFRHLYQKVDSMLDYSSRLVYDNKVIPKSYYRLKTLFKMSTNSIELISLHNFCIP